MEHSSSAPLSVDAAIEYVAATCLSPGPPRTVGVELEWLVNDAHDPTLPIDPARVAAALPDPATLSGRLTREPGGQVELSSAPAPSLAASVAASHADLRRLRAGLAAADLRLTGRGADPSRPPVRVVHTRRYQAMETFFDQAGPDGRIMMCSTASVQVCLDAGLLGGGTAGIGHRWRVAHAIGPVLVAAFANSPWHAGRPTGWKSTRQAVWARLDPSRTAAPRGDDPAVAWAQYALDARVLCIRDTQADEACRNRPSQRLSGSGSAGREAGTGSEAGSGAAGSGEGGDGGEVPCWPVPVGLNFRDWLAGAGPRPATIDDLEFHLTTLFPPVRPRRWLELRMIDAQSGDDGWVVPVAVATALIEDGAAGEYALAATERWDPFGTEPSLRAARLGLADPDLHAAATSCFEAARGALGRLGAPRAITEAVDQFADRYVSAGRCPADDAESTTVDTPARLEKSHGRSHR